ncbi:LysR substrate-binding domain-containing protein [Ruegeria sp. PrR005]|uniref:LysR family transcriptional regulator n=1 Tax=Ruegeria sp. PrR005 TaxID=2706882 RepID=A0A6B2NH12_9RHOB|nr:LysR substrate-binding domain-containing protein [Ruegeria sp. PrR005]NDW43461.1 LysR family transcriptional regulator [Ruegeria sp. PrR005]
MNFTLRQLRYFIALAEQRNFGRAAEVCHVSQPALSVQIRALEDCVGGRLVERRARDVVLTPFGRTVLPLVQQVLANAERLDRFAQAQAGEGTLSLGLIPTMAPYLLPGVLAELRARNLSLKIHVREARTEQLLAALNKGELDAAVLALPVAQAGLTAVELFEDRFLLAGSAARLERLQQETARIRPTDLQPAQLMLLEDGHCLTDQALEVCGHDRNAAGINMGASSLGTLSRLVAAGFGMTLMPELAARAEAAAVPDLCLHRFPMPEPRRIVGLARRISTYRESWFDDLVAVIRAVGQEIVTAARNGEADPPSVEDPTRA